MLMVSVFDNIENQVDQFMKDLEKEISIRKAEEWNRKIQKRKKKREMPLDIKHSK